jgi:nitrite reductase (NADH) large subunit
MKLVIVGNGVAGVSTARYVAERAPGSEITLYTDESYHYYPRPRLIDFLAGQLAAEKLSQYAAEWYEKRGIRVVLGCSVADIQPQAHRIILAEGSPVGYDQLVLANGSRSWIPPIKGSDLAGVHTLRTLEDALALKRKAQQARCIVVLGGGLLGLDTAMALHAYCRQVQVIELLPRLLPRQLDTQGAALLQGMIEARGVEVIVGESCQEIGGQGHVSQLRLASGGQIEADLVIISAGVRPNIALAKKADLACGVGVMVDQSMRTSAPDIFAVGDVAEFQGKTWGIIPPAIEQAKVAAAQICGDSSAIYRGTIPSTTLKVTGIDVTSIGEVNPLGEGFVEIRRGGGASYEKVVIRDGRVVGAILVGDRAHVRAVSQLIERQVDVSAHVDELLADGFDLMSLMGAVASGA